MSLLITSKPKKPKSKKKKNHKEKSKVKSGFNRNGINQITGTRYDTLGYDQFGYNESGKNCIGFTRLQMGKLFKNAKSYKSSNAIKPTKVRYYGGFFLAQRYLYV